MTIHLVRHARAGSRSRWKGDDARRPLSKAGRLQADAISDRLERESIDLIVSSPYARCVDTVEPLAKRVGIRVATSDALAEGAGLSRALHLMEEVRDRDVVLCTHGDIIEVLLDHFAQHGVELGDHRIEKGSTWVLEMGEDGVDAACYVPPPMI